VPTSVTMPMLGLTMEEGTVAAWLKQEGDPVEKDEPLLTVEMDKGTQDVPSPASGRLGRILVQTGQTVAVRTPIAEILAEGEEPTAPAGGGRESPAAATAAEGQAAAPVTAAGPQRAAATTAEGEPRTAGTGRQAVAAHAATASGGVGPRGRRFVSPRARRRARELGVELGAVPGTGPHGRIVEADVLMAAQTVGEPQRLLVTPVARRLALEHGVPLEQLQGTGPGGRVTQEDVQRAADQLGRAAAPAGPAPTEVRPAAADGQVVPLSRIRRITAERMAASSQTVARVTLFLDADLSEAARLRRQLAPEFERLGVPKLPWDALFAKAAGLALAEHPHVNAQWVEGQGLRRNPDVHVGVALALEPEGLVVPVLRHADSRSLRELAGDLVQLADKARANRLSPTEMQGGSFTITNLGQHRVDGFTPIVNPPEAAILGVGRVADRAVVVDGRIEARTMCTLSLSFDHRVVDGAPAAAFLARLAELLERPYTLLGI
jgi:pyruvate dehydrogenase E2 component (dihydrolipoamide acetyltransferase)